MLMMAKMVGLTVGGGGGGSLTFDNAADFNGSSDSLNRLSALTGATEGKTFTFSCWYLSRGPYPGFLWQSTPDGEFVGGLAVDGHYLIGTNSASDYQLGAELSLPVDDDVWHHLLVSVDLTNTARRHVYCDDVPVSTSWNVFNNANIAINAARTYFGRGDEFGYYHDGKLAYGYLDQTYRDLSVTGNRRLFLNADLTPAAGQAALNPLIYLPMIGPTFETNLGTGGDFAVSGTL